MNKGLAVQECFPGMLFYVLSIIGGQTTAESGDNKLSLFMFLESRYFNDFSSFLRFWFPSYVFYHWVLSQTAAAGNVGLGLWKGGLRIFLSCCFYCEIQSHSVHWLSGLSSLVCSSMVTSPFISTVWCCRPYKPYIFWKLIIWWWRWPRQRHTKRQRHTDTDKYKYKVLPRPNVCYIYQKQGQRQKPNFMHY